MHPRHAGECIKPPPVSQVLRGAARDTGLRVAAFVCVKMKKIVR